LRKALIFKLAGSLDPVLHWILSVKRESSVVSFSQDSRLTTHV